MNYHIMMQDKFFDSYIEDFHEIGEEKNNIFLFRENKGDRDYIKTQRAVEYIGHDPIAIKTRLSSIAPTDNIFIHWYDMFIGEIVYDLPNKIFVSLMGGDFYADPVECNVNFLYDTKTRKIVYRFNKHFKRIYFRPNLLRMLKHWWKNPKKKKALYDKKHKYISRIDYILIPKETTSEIEFVKTKYPNFRAVHLSFCFNQNFDQTLIAPQNNCSNERIKILLGNSLDPSNNHLDAFETLKNIKSEFEIHCPLSYGDNRYKDIIIKRGKKLFGERFFPITDFMTNEQYIEFISSVDLIMMYHNRSQAMGNITIALTLGKPVFVKRNNPIFDFYSNLSIECYDANKINSLNLEKIISKQKDSIQLNLNTLKRVHSKERRLFDLKKILTEYC